ncbi:MAG: hypothetical protein AAGI23_08305 [Bacteroidota bacterium]
MKILVIRFSSIGDIVLTTPVVRCLHQQLDCEIHFLTKQSYATLLTSNPYIARVWTIQKRVREVAADLKLEEFDCIIDLHHNLRSWQVRLTLQKTNFLFRQNQFCQMADGQIQDQSPAGCAYRRSLLGDYKKARCPK